MDLETQSSVSIEVADESVHGHIIHCSASDICIKIEERYGGFEESRHIPYFARSKFDFRGAYGDLTATNLLRNLYARYAQLKASKAAASKALDAYYATAKEQYAQIARLEVEKRSLREHFRTGILNQKQYQREVHENRALEFMAEDRLNGLFSEMFSGILGRGFYFQERECALKQIRQLIPGK